MINNMEIRSGILIGYHDCSEVTEITIPDTVTVIGEDAFERCENLTSVIIPDSVAIIADEAFFECKNLISVTIGNSVATIGDYAFYYCKRLISLTIPDSVREIGTCTFFRCESLTSITIPNRLEFIGSEAFRYCKNLKTKKANYKAFDFFEGKLMCRNYEYKEDEWSENIDDIEICERGYHFCDNLFAIFNYYWGRIDEDFVIYECEVGEKIETDGIKSVTNTIKPVKRLYREDVIRILNER